MNQQSLEVTHIDSAASIAALNASEINEQISTAKAYPRDEQFALAKVKRLATISPATAAECFYSLRRKDTDGSKVIEGPSVRLAEIVASSWGNLRVQTQIIGNDGRFITARGICHDLESNVAVASEVKRPIVNKMGRTYSEDMQAVTGNAAAAIAFRNAVFKVVPKAVISEAIGAIKVSLQEDAAADFEDSKRKMFSWFQKQGVTPAMICAYFEISGEEEITPEIIAELRTTATAISEKQVTAQELFIAPFEAAQTAKGGAESQASDSGIKARLAKARKAQEAAEKGEEYQGSIVDAEQDMPSDI